MNRRAAGTQHYSPFAGKAWLLKSSLYLCVCTCVCADTNADGWPFMADQSQIANENEDTENNLLCSHFGSYIHLNLFLKFYFKSMRSVRLNKQETNQSNYSQSNTNL